ncbi:MAG: peptidoglycan DD-metalloendopeptidase family protein [Oscillospiraceae bacterium]|nr:peptidoglycan DD-metalloendopeptidase family protein [Oscillospiraceae bacterium]
MVKKQRSRQKRFAAVLALILAVLLLLPLIATVVTSAGAVTQSEIDALRGNANEIAAQRKELERKLAEIKNDKSKALEQKKLLDDQMANLEREIANIEKQIDAYNALIAEKEAEIAVAQGKEEAQFELFCQRARAMEEDENVSYWSILFSAASFADLLDRFAFVNEIIEYDNAVMENLVAIRKQIEDDKQTLEESKAEVEKVKEQKEASKKALNSKVAEAQALVNEIKEKEDEYAAAAAAIKKEEAAVLAEVLRLQRQLDAQNAPKGDGTYIWPLPAGYYTLTSKFGPRTHPITGKFHNHSGTDIAAPRNTPIYAAASGTVSVSTYGNSYGQYVVIYHGNGTSTLYAHMIIGSQTVKAGDTVTQGQIIGRVGTSGSSTGYHLHLEFQVNGVRKDAESYYPQLDSKFIRRY